MRKYVYGAVVSVLVGLNAVLVFWRRAGGRRPAARPKNAALDTTPPVRPASPTSAPAAALNTHMPATPAPESMETNPRVPPAAPPKGGLSLDTSLFLLALLVFLLTRLIELNHWPIYFFSDEAIQTVQAANFLQNGFRDYAGSLFPTYFQNGSYFNLSVSVYAQVVPYLLFGYSIFITRAVSVLFALSGAAAVGLTLKNIFAVRWWWLGTLLLAVTPTFFLHSRTAFETVIGTSLYAWFLYFYLRYRYHRPRDLSLAFLAGALCFYAYSPAQVVVVVTGALLLLSDWRYHWRTLRTHPRAIVFGLLLLIVLALPYLRFQSEHPNESYYHLRILDSYWLKPSLTLGDKLRQFISEYTYGLSPAFWYAPDNGRDLIRHTMKGYGHILPVTLPFLLIGLIECVRRLRSSMHRAVLLALLATPVGGALVQVQVYRVMSFVVPAALLTAFGLIAVLNWIAKRIAYRSLAVGVFAVLSAINLFMLYDALTYGPTWYTNYGMGGLQYGGQQVFGAVREELERNPETRVIVSPTWANATNNLLWFFLPNEKRVQMGNIDAYQFKQQDLTDQTLLVMTPTEYERAQKDPKFANIRVERIIPYPDGRDGFYFVRLEYSPQAKAIFASENAARHQPVREDTTVDGQPVSVLHSQLDRGRIGDIFDNDPYTLIRTLVDNPAIIEITFAEPRSLAGLKLTTATMDFNLTAKLYPTDSDTPLIISRDFIKQGPDPTVEVPFDPVPPSPIKTIRLEIKDLKPAQEAHIHVRELQLR